MQISLQSGNPFSRMVMGLEIGFSSVKAVWVRPASGGGEIVDFVIEELNGDTGDLAAALSRISRKVKVPHLRTIAVFSGEGIYEGASLLPAMPEKDLANFLRMTLVDKGSLDLTDPVIKFFVSRIKPAGKKRAVMTMAANAPAWNNLLELATRGHISLASLIFSGAAFESIIPASAENVLLVNVGARETLLYLYRNGALAFIRRETMLGSDYLTRDMTMEMATPGGTIGLKPDQAEEIKRRVGIPPSGQMEDSTEGITLNEIWSMLRPWCDRLAGAIKDSMIFSHQQFGPARVKTVYLTGGGAMLPHLSDYLADNCGCEVAMLPDPGHLSWSSDVLREEFTRIAPRLQTALGAALENGPKTNLLPLKNIVSRKLLLPLRVLWIIIPFFAIALGALGLVTARQVRLAEIREDQLAHLLSSRQVEAEQWRRVYSSEKEIFQSRQLIRQALHHPDLWIGTFREISRSLPDRIVLNRLILNHSGEEGLLTFEGKVIPGEPDGQNREIPEEILTAFTRRLMKSPFFSNARNLEAGENQAGDFLFTFVVLLQRGEGG